MLHTMPTLPNLIIRASAGTGKTFQLSNRFLALLGSNVGVDRILATTFTRKAAGEILGRVLLRLAEAAVDDRACAELAKFTELDSLDRSRCLALLQRTVQHLHRLRVSTLDSFFAQIARSFSLELGLPPGWQVCEELEDKRLRSEAINAVLQEGDTRDLLRLVHLLTKGEASRSVSQLIHDTIDSLYHVFLETSPEAWQRVPKKKLLDEKELELLIEQLRGMPLSDKRFAKARDADCDRAAVGEWEAFVNKGLAAKVLAGVEEFYRKPIPSEAVAIYRQILDQARAVITNRIAQQTEGTHELLSQFARHYQRIKYRRGALRFDPTAR